MNKKIDLITALTLLNPGYFGKVCFSSSKIWSKNLRIEHLVSAIPIIIESDFFCPYLNILIEQIYKIQVIIKKGNLQLSFLQQQQS